MNYQTSNLKRSWNPFTQYILDTTFPSRMTVSLFSFLCPQLHQYPSNIRIRLNICSLWRFLTDFPYPRKHSSREPTSTISTIQRAFHKNLYSHGFQKIQRNSLTFLIFVQGLNIKTYQLTHTQTNVNICSIKFNHIYGQI